MVENIQQQGSSMPGIGDPAPEFEALTAQGVVNFPDDYNGKWTILFSHPAHYTPESNAVGMSFEQIEAQFKEANCELVELEFEGFYSQVIWLQTIKEKMEYERMKNIKMEFPCKKVTMDVAAKYGLVHSEKDSAELVSTVFFINPKGIIRTIVYCPLNLEKNFYELYKVALALQKAEEIEINTIRNLRSKDNIFISQSGVYERNIGKRGHSKQDCNYWFC